MAEQTASRTLPPPIKPRRLVRADGGRYVTSDGWLRFTPRYDGRRMLGFSAETLRDPQVPDIPGVHPLSTWRDRYCAPDGRVPWLVCDMDDGVLRVAPSRQAAVAWAEDHTCAPVRERHHGAGSTCYDYVFGYPGEDDNTCVFIMRADNAGRHGFDPVQQPLYPYPDAPHEPGPRGRSSGE